MSIIKIPDLGGASSVTVIEILVQPGDTVVKDQPLVTLESEKATMEVPASEDGVVETILVTLNQSVQEGDEMMALKEAVNETPPSEEIPPVEKKTVTSSTTLHQVLAPDMGSAGAATVIEILVKAGDRVTKEEGLVTLEGEKATMEIPAPMDGEIKKVHINIDQEVTQGMLIIEMQGESDSQVNEETPATAPPPPITDTSVPNEPVVSASSQHVYSSPSVRRYAREFGIDLGLIKGTGEKGRVQKSDLIAFVKSRVNGGGSAIPSVPDEDFSKYGEIHSAPLSRIKQFTAKNMQRNWLNVPHVTQFHEVEVTELTKAFSSLKKECKAKGQKITLLPYLMKALVNSLKEFPEFNSSLHPDGKTLILKSYFHIGIAADTPQGLVVPVIRDVDQKEFMGLNQELKEVSEQAREKGLPPQAMKGGSMTISNLGGIGGGHFTPIINVPEVAILGVSRQFKKPILIDGQWQEQDVLPISLSYDHRVIDGAQGARFLMHLSNEITTRVNELLIGE